MENNQLDVKALIDAVSQASTRAQESNQKHSLELSKQRVDALLQFLDKAALAVGPLMELHFSKRMELREREEKLEVARQEHEIRMQELKIKTAEVAAGKGKSQGREQVREIFPGDLTELLKDKS